VTGRSRRRDAFTRLLPVGAALAVAGLVTAASIAPMGAVQSSYAVSFPRGETAETQALEILAAAAHFTTRDAYGATAKPVEPEPASFAFSAPAAGTPDPGTAQAIAYDIVMAMGLGEGEYSCLVALWNRESGWNVYAHNASSGAYGIPQALPGDKMASAGADWQTNPVTQINWGLSYIMGRYGSPCAAWGHSESYGWY